MDTSVKIQTQMLEVFMADRKITDQDPTLGSGCGIFELDLKGKMGCETGCVNRGEWASLGNRKRVGKEGKVGMG